MRKTLIVLLAALLLCGCTGTVSSDVSGVAPAEENRLVIFSCLDEAVCDPLVTEFQQRTGIWVRVETGSAPELMERIRQEEGCDLLLGCTADFLEANADCFDSWQPEALWAENCSTGECWTPLSLGALVVVYNPKLIRQNPPTGWGSLLNPDWKGKIAFADPARSDFGRTVLAALIQCRKESPEAVMTACAANLSTLLGSADEVVSRVADGSFCLGIAPEQAALTAVEAGADLTVVYPAEGTVLVPDGGAVVKDCAHPENARAFLRFATGKDAQNYAMTHCARRSVLRELAVLPENPVALELSGAAALQKTMLEDWQRIWGDGV